MKRCSRAVEAELELSLSCGEDKPAGKIFYRRKKAAADGVFECRTCGRRFTTFQALGGHRTSHMRRRTSQSRSGSAVHRCTVCGARFAMGQALGGHMRRHKSNMGEEGLLIKQNQVRKVDGLGMMAPLEVSLFDVIPRSSSHCQLLELFV